jgi:hypothetical protein
MAFSMRPDKLSMLPDGDTPSLLKFRQIKDVEAPLVNS